MKIFSCVLLFLFLYLDPFLSKFLYTVWNTETKDFFVLHMGLQLFQHDFWKNHHLCAELLLHHCQKLIVCMNVGLLLDYVAPLIFFTIYANTALFRLL